MAAFDVSLESVLESINERFVDVVAATNFNLLHQSHYDDYYQENYVFTVTNVLRCDKSSIVFRFFVHLVGMLYTLNSFGLQLEEKGGRSKKGNATSIIVNIKTFLPITEENWSQNALLNNNYLSHPSLRQVFDDWQTTDMLKWARAAI